jgi:hypothetical protein
MGIGNQRAFIMNQKNRNLLWIKVVLSVVTAVSVPNALAFKGVIEIHGILKSPGCQIGLQSLQTLKGQAQLRGSDCGLTTATGNPMSSVSIAQVIEETPDVTQGVTSPNRLITLQYR